MTLRQFLLTTIAALVIVGVAACVLFKTPLAHAGALCGTASFYGRESGPTMANGQPFNPSAMTAAMWGPRFGTRVRVTDQRTGRSVVVTITDRGPRLDLHRLIDLSEGAARRLGMGGLAKVCLSTP